MQISQSSIFQEGSSVILWLFLTLFYILFIIVFYILYYILLVSIFKLFLLYHLYYILVLFLDLNHSVVNVVHRIINVTTVV